MPTLSLSKLGSNGKAHNWTHVLTPLNELETFFNTTKLNYQNIQTNGIRSANVRAHAGVSTGRIKVRNSTGSTLTAGTLVYFSGTYNDGTDDYPTVAKAVSTNADSSVKYAQAIVESDISNGADGTVVDRLEIGSLDTSGLTSGGAVFLSSTAGGYVTALSSLSGTDYRVQVVGYVGKVDGSTGTIVFGLWDVLPVSIQNQIIVGEDDTGYDVTFYGATSGSYMLWDESADALKLVGATLDMGESNITNVGDIALDTISSDAGTTVSVILGTDAGDDFKVNNGGDIFFVEGDTGDVGVGGVTKPSSWPDVDKLVTIEGTQPALFFKDTTASAKAFVVVVDGDVFYIANDTDNDASLQFAEAGNLGINTGSFGTNAKGVIALANGTAPSSSPANLVQLYAEDVTSSSELKVRDEAGNVTTLSPHNFSLVGEPSEDMAWAYYSERDGRAINVDMLRLARLVEQVTGEQLVHISEVA